MEGPEMANTAHKQTKQTQGGEHISHKKKKKNRALTVLIVLLIILAALVGIAIFILTRSKPEKDEGIDFNVTMEPETEDEDETEDPDAVIIDSAVVDSTLDAVDNVVTKDEGWIHYLLLGVDGEAAGYKGKRSDAMIVMSVNETEGKVILSSIPRDTMVYIDGKGLDKLTHAYAYGGVALTIQTFEENFDIDIAGYVVVNFNAMVEVVDTLGGLTLTLTDAEAKHMGDYYAAWGLSGGTQLLSGKEVLAYCRVRKIDSDYVRNDRQFKVLKAIYDKVKTMSVTKYTSLISAVYDDIYTDIMVKDLISLAGNLMDIMDGGELVNKKLVDSDNSRSGRLNGVSYVLMDNLEDVVTAWREDALGITDYVPSERVKQISKLLQSSTQ
jgi:LCP family protein required for cell wall assembly